MVLVSNEWLCNEDGKLHDKTQANPQYRNTNQTTTVLESGKSKSTPRINATTTTTTTPVAAAASARTTYKGGSLKSNYRASDKRTGISSAADNSTKADPSSTKAAGYLGNRRFRSLQDNIRKMDMKKSEEDDITSITAREKHEMETYENSGDSNINNDTNTVSTITMDNSLDAEAENNNADFERTLAAVITGCENLDSNTNTLQAPSSQRLHTQNQSQSQSQSQSTSSYSENALKNVLCTMISRGQALNLLGLDDNGALNSQQQQQQQQIPQSAKSYSSSIVSNATLEPTQQPQTQTQQTLNSNNVVGTTCSSTVITSTPAADMDNNIQTNGEAKIVLLKEEKSHHFETRTISLKPNIECKVGRLIAKSKANEGNAIFDCKVLSRNHAVLWYSDDGKFWVKDTKSSNGTFINDTKLGNEPAELNFGDIVKFGVEVMETSRKEMHGCIIAMVKLYLPDGREAISHDGTVQRTQFASGNRISYDEMHRLNAFMQEAAQREKMLKAKLSSLQNVLDTTRKNSALCWQSMISEDQLLHKITLLEKKLQVMEKNAPENALRNEVMKLLDDKTSYQLTAKEALRKVYQERCDALQMLAKVEAAYAASENECAILREQIMTSKKAVQELNAHLIQLETEYNDYKTETMRQAEEAKTEADLHINELRMQLRSYEDECEELRTEMAKIQLQMVRQDQEQELQEQALAKLDAVIGDIGMDDEDDDENNEKGAEHMDGIDNEKIVGSTKPLNEIKQNQSDDAKPNTEKEYLQNGKLEDGNVSKVIKKKSKKERRQLEELKQKVVRKSTVMQWLKNSDLNQCDDAENLLKAMCNESDSGDENNGITAPKSTSPRTATQKHDQEIQDMPIGAGTNKSKSLGNFESVCKKFSTILEDVQINLQRVEHENKLETDKAERIIASLNDGTDIHDSDEDDADLVANDEFLLNSDTAANAGKSSKNYLLLKSSVNKLRDAFNEICEQQIDVGDDTKKLDHSATEITNSMQTQSQKCADNQNSTSSSAVKKIVTQSTLVPQPSTMTAISGISGSDQLSPDQAIEMLHIECDSWRDKVAELSMQIKELSDEKLALQKAIANVNHSNETEEITTTTPESTTTTTTIVHEDTEKESATLEQTSNSECEPRISAGTTLKANTSTSSFDVEQSQLNAEIDAYAAAAVSAANANANDVEKAFDDEIRDELISLNCVQAEREEELVIYKERLEKSESSNLQLRNEILKLKQKARSRTQVIIRQALPFGAVAIAALVYYLTVRF